MPAPVPVGELAADGRADRGAQAQEGPHKALFDCVDIEAVGAVRQIHVGQRRRDDAGVVAEEQRAERRHQGDEPQRALLAGRRGLVDQLLDPPSRRWG